MHFPGFTSELPAWASDLQDSQCSLPGNLTDTCQVMPGSEPVPCKDYVFDQSAMESTVVTEFLAVCSNSAWRTVSGPSYMFAMLVGSSFFGWFADRFGRRATFPVAVGFLTVGSFGAGLAPSYPSYIVFRFLASIGGMGLFITSFVLLMEYSGPKGRTLFGFGIQLPFGLGVVYMGVLAIFIRNWRLLALAVAAPYPVLLLLSYWIPESIRWALANGRKAAVAKNVTLMAKVNKVSLPEDFLEHLLSGSRRAKTVVAKKRPDEFFAAVRSGSIRCRFLIMAWNWVAVTLSYYGVGLSASLSSDLHLSYAAIAVIELPGYLFAMVSAHFLGRRPTMAGVQILAAFACIGAGSLPGDYEVLKILLVMVGKFGASAAFGVVYVYTAELFPTPMRNRAVGLCSMFARVGGILAPLTLELGAVWPQLPFLIVGVTALSGGFSAIWLPETLGKELPDTLEEALALSKSNSEESVQEVEIKA